MEGRKGRGKRRWEGAGGNGRQGQQGGCREGSWLRPLPGRGSALRLPRCPPRARGVGGPGAPVRPGADGSHIQASPAREASGKDSGHRGQLASLRIPTGRAPADNAPPSGDLAGLGALLSRREARGGAQPAVQPAPHPGSPSPSQPRAQEPPGPGVGTLPQAYGSPKWTRRALILALLLRELSGSNVSPRGRAIAPARDPRMGVPARAAALGRGPGNWCHLVMTCQVHPVCQALGWALGTRR